MAAELKADMAGMKQELFDLPEAVETRLLAEFWTWARTADAGTGKALPW